MAGFNCTCTSGGIGNIGIPDCAAVFSRVERNIFLSTYDSNGDKSGIPSTAIVNGVIPESYFIGKLDAVNAKDRWHITPKTHDSVTLGRTDDQEETTASGNIYFLDSGVKTVSFQIKKLPGSLIGELKSCNSISTYEIGQDGELLGEYSDNGTIFYPLLIQDGTFKANNFPKGNDAEQYIEISYNLDKTAKESNFLMLSRETIGLTNLLKAKSISGYTLSATTGATQSDTQLFVTAESFIGGTAFNLNKLREATVTAEWTIIDTVNGNAVITPTSITESTNGDYVFNIPSTTSTFDISFTKVRTSVESRGATSNTTLSLTN